MTPTKRILTYAGILIATGLATIAALTLLPQATSVAGAIPPVVWVGATAVLAAAALLFLLPQVGGWLRDRTMGRLRSNLNVVVEQAVGSADLALEAKPQLDPAVREAHSANLVQLRFPSSSGFTGKTKIHHNGSLAVTKPITPGMDLAAAVDFAYVEDPEIRAAASLARDLVASEFPGTVPALVTTIGGLHHEKGTTFGRTFAFQGDALSWPEAHLSMVQLFHEPNKRRPQPCLPHEPASPASEEAGREAGAAAGKEPRRNLRFPVPHPRRSRVPDGSEAPTRARSVRRLDYPVTHRQDLLLKGLVHWAHGLIGLARVKAVGDIARVDAKLRRAVGVAEVASQWGLTHGAGIETKRITRDAGSGWFGSFSDEVYTVPSRAALTPLIQRLKLQGVRTLEGYDFVPGDCEEEGRGRHVLLFAYGAPELVRELPEVVRKALAIEPDQYFPVAAGIPGARGAHFVLFVEASNGELSEGRDAAYPGLTEHPLWESYLEAVDQWNQVKGDAPDAVAQEAN